MTGSITKITISSKNVGVTLAVILVSVYEINIIKIKNIVFIILFIFNSIFKLDHNIIQLKISRVK
jgi:hypothetical protein